MSVITEHADHATLINVFTVEPERARQLADLLTAATEEVMQHVDGFISANIHLSTDGTRVVNYAQWRSAEAFELPPDPALPTFGSRPSSSGRTSKAIAT